MHNNTNGQFAQDVDVLVEEAMAAAGVEKSRPANEPSVNGFQEPSLPHPHAGSTPTINAQEQYSKIQSLSARLSQKDTKESTVTHHKDAPKPPQQLQNGAQNNARPQIPAGKGARPNESLAKKAQAQSEPPSRPTSRRQSAENIAAKLPNDRPHVERPPSRQRSPARPARPQIDTRSEPKSFVTGLHPEIEEWLDLTGYHDPEYRQATLNLMRKRKRLDELQSSFKQEELEFLETFQNQSQAAHIAAGRRSSSVMPPPPVPAKHQNGNVTNTNIPLDSPTTAYKRQRSLEPARDPVAPPRKIQRPSYPEEEREYKIRSATEHDSRPGSPLHDHWRPARPRGAPLESRIRGQGEATPSAEYGGRYYDADEGNLAQRDAYYYDYADRDQNRGRARDWDQAPRGNAGGQRARAGHRGNHHHKDNGRGARRG